MIGGKTTVIVLPMRGLRMAQKIGALGTALRREFHHGCLLTGRVDRGAGTILCIPMVMIRRDRP
jgi:hypothetical protein